MFPQQYFAAFAGLEIPTEKKIMNKVNFENYEVRYLLLILSRKGSRTKHEISMR